METLYSQEEKSTTKHIDLHNKIVIPMDIPASPISHSIDTPHFGPISDIFRKIRQYSLCGLTDDAYLTDDESDVCSMASDETDNDILDIFEEEDYVSIVEFIHELVENYIDTNFLEQSSPGFTEKIVAFVSTVLFDLWEDYGFSMEESSEIELKKWIQYEIESFMETLSIWIPPRQGKSHFSREIARESLHGKIEQLSSIIIPEQRSQEWYNQRNNLLTASNIWKVFSTQAQYNSLVVEKCKPCENAESMRSVSTASSLHWGILFEPLTLQIYSMKNKTKVGEFGCIVHPQHSFLGASPDGINIDPSSPLYGRMIEIKNVVSRQITGIPLEAYWIQMQLQMEICDLDECDFIETKFSKISRETWMDNSDESISGVILHVGPRIFVPFSTREIDNDDIDYDIDSDTRKVVYADTQSNQEPFYVYIPFDVSRENMDTWIQDYKNKNPNMVIMDTIYWKLEHYSCVFVHRNKEWFLEALPKIKECWATIEHERIHGYQHRLSSKKKTTEVIHTDTMCSVQMPAKSSVCLVKLDY